MMRERLRQIARLEKKLKPDIERTQRLKSQEQFIACMAASYAANVAFIVRYGAPRIDEPLWRACKRVENSEAWDKYCEMFPRTLRQVDYRFGKGVFATQSIRHGLIRFFPGSDERDKLNRIFEIAPPWLIWFTGADDAARMIGVRVPDLSAVSCFQRRPISSDVYPEQRYVLPEGKFEQLPWPDGVIRAPEARVRIVDKTKWPMLLPKERIDHLREETLEVVNASDRRATVRAIMARR